MDALLYNSEYGRKAFHLACGLISTTAIDFEREHITAVIEANGEIAFYDDAKEPLAAVTLPAQTGGREHYEDVECEVTNGALMLYFPIYEWEDNYPHCDGEYDRWTKVTIGHHTVTLDIISHEITVA